MYICFFLCKLRPILETELDSQTIIFVDEPITVAEHGFPAEDISYRIAAYPHTNRSSFSGNRSLLRIAYILLGCVLSFFLSSHICPKAANAHQSHVHHGDHCLHYQQGHNQHQHHHSATQKMTHGHDAEPQEFQTSAPTPPTPFCTGNAAMYHDGFRFTYASNGTSPCLNLLFTTWILSTPAKFFSGMFFLGLLAALTEGLSAFRRGTRRWMPSGCERKCLLTTLHAVQALLGYWLMMGAMTYSIELLLSIVAGTAGGYAAFFNDWGGVTGVEKERELSPMRSRRGGGACIRTGSAPTVAVPHPPVPLKKPRNGPMVSMRTWP